MKWGRWRGVYFLAARSPKFALFSFSLLTEKPISVQLHIDFDLKYKNIKVKF
jgi:hypothetical protein